MAFGAKPGASAPGRVLLALVSVASLTTGGCVTWWRVASPERLEQAPPAVAAPPAAGYAVRVKSTTFGSGREGILDALRDAPALRDADVVDDAPEKGLWIEVTAGGKGADVPAYTPRPYVATNFFYALMIAFAGTIPAPMFDHERVIAFNVHRDGAHVGTYEYRVSRSGFVWPIMFFLLAAQSVTPSEYDVMQEITQRFLRDAAADGAFHPWPPDWKPPADYRVAAAAPDGKTCAKDSECPITALCVVGRCRETNP